MSRGISRVTLPDTASRLRQRAKALGVSVPPRAGERLVIYFDLLFRWNAKMNLTALTETDAAIDRLLLEPVAAALELPHYADLMVSGPGAAPPPIRRRLPPNCPGW